MLLPLGNAHAEDAGGSEERKHNDVELFVGGTFYDGERDLSLGAAYGHTFGEKFATGVFAEYTAGSGREWVFAVPFVWRVMGAWEAEIAPGIERESGDNEYLTRLGVNYKFEFNGWTLTPELSFDFVDSEMKTVAGVSFGWDF